MVRLDHDPLPVTVTELCSAEVLFLGMLELGQHKLEILISPEQDLAQDSVPIVISVDHLYLQDVDHDFRDHGQFVHIKDSALMVPGNLVSVDSVWRLDFQVPVYRWMHQKMNLGWLI